MKNTSLILKILFQFRRCVMYLNLMPPYTHKARQRLDNSREDFPADAFGDGITEFQNPIGRVDEC